LEERLGVRLLHRNTRSLRMSPAGTELYRHARGILSALQDAAQAVQPQDAAPRGLLRVSVPPLNGAGFRAMLLDFAKKYPKVQLEVIATTAHQDLQRDQIDVAWRAGPSLDPGLVARRLHRTRIQAAASPAYLLEHGTPEHPSDLSEHRCIVGFARGERPRTAWPTLGGGSVRINPALAFNDMALTYEATLAGLGIALLPATIAQQAIDTGQLVAVLPEHIDMEAQVSLVFVERHLMKPALRAFLDHSVAWTETHGLWDLVKEL
jgi:DNA-binding transcriptional LysR family regulator